MSVSVIRAVDQTVAADFDSDAQWCRWEKLCGQTGIRVFGWETQMIILSGSPATDRRRPTANTSTISTPPSRRVPERAPPKRNTEGFGLRRPSGKSLRLRSAYGGATAADRRTMTRPRAVRMLCAVNNCAWKGQSDFCDTNGNSPRPQDTRPRPRPSGDLPFQRCQQGLGILAVDRGADAVGGRFQAQPGLIWYARGRSERGPIVQGIRIVFASPDRLA